MDNKTKTIGNENLISTEEDILVSYLKKNLNMVNAVSGEVQVSSGFYVKYAKRIFDLLIAVPAFTVFLPLNFLLGICTFFDVGSPIFYKQTRLGKNGEPFIIVKFRNMNENKDADGKLLPPKERVTKFGKFVRKVSLDELLNLWSIIKGDMSIIGPRPLPASFAERMSERHKKRMEVRPGLECPRVIAGDPEQCQYQNQFENDVWYVGNVSFKTDLKLFLLLFKMALNLKKRSKAAEGNGYFAGYDKNGIATTLNRFKRMYPDEWKKVKESYHG